jgi:hypothetical protein
MESALFGLFVVAILADQVQSIRSDRSLIDTLQLNETTRMSQQILPPTKILFRKVFGPGKKKSNTKKNNIYIYRIFRSYDFMVITM